jgi:hypothetical protein
MISLAFILGVLPLMIAQGAGAEMRRTPGTAVERAKSERINMSNMNEQEES